MNRFLQNRNALFALFFASLALAWFFSLSGGSKSGVHIDVPEVDVAVAKAMVDAGVMVVDVRGADAYAHRHVPGAILVPLETLRESIPANLAAAKDLPVLVYCGDGATHGPDATRLLRQAGFTKAVNMKPGMDGWARAGLPVKTG